jgi:hypothetical protein
MRKAAIPLSEPLRRPVNRALALEPHHPSARDPVAVDVESGDRHPRRRTALAAETAPSSLRFCPQTLTMSQAIKYLVLPQAHSTRRTIPRAAASPTVSIGVFM